jgi:hypothetical protein
MKGVSNARLYEAGAIHFINTTKYRSDVEIL